MMGGMGGGAGGMDMSAISVHRDELFAPGNLTLSSRRAAMMEQMKGMGGMPGMDDMGPPPDLSGAEADLAAGDDDLDDLPDLEEDNVD
mgnify:FL=1